MATCSCKINPRRWQQFSALQSISTSEHILHAPYYLFNHPSNLAFLEFFYFCHSSVYMYMMREFTRAWIWRSENNMQESVPPLCRFQRSLRSGSFLSKRFYWWSISSAPNVCCLTSIVPVSVSILNACLTTCCFPFTPSHCHWRHRAPQQSHTGQVSSAPSQYALVRSLVIGVVSLLFLSRPVTNDFHFYTQ